MVNNKAGKYITLNTLKHFKDVENQLTDTKINTKINNIKKITGNEVHYIASTNGETPPGLDAAWQTSIPALQTDEYLWTRTKFNYSDGTSEYLYSVGSKGPKGDKGDEGSSAFYIVIDNDFDSVPCDSSGNIVSGYNYNLQTKHHITAFLGEYSIPFKVSNTVPTSGTGFVIVYKVTNVTFQGADRDTASAEAYEAWVNNLTSAAGSVIYSLYNGTKLVANAKFEISKLYAGEKGADAVDYWIELSDYQIKKDKNGNITPTSITVNFRTQVGQGTISNYESKYSYIIDNADEPVIGTASTVTLNSTTLGYINKQLTITLYLKGTNTVVDRETISMVSDGQDGVSISGVKEYYLATSLASGVTTSTLGWVDMSVSGATMPQISAENPYLWNYEVIIRGTENLTTDPALIGKWSENGADGTDGRGIVSITEYYQATSSTTAPAVTSGNWTANGWKITPQTTTETNKYLWNYEVVTYTTGNPTYTDPCIIGTHGERGSDGSDGSDGNDGYTPYIGNNGNWWINGVDTGIKAEGQDGQDGKDGIDGQDGKNGSSVGYLYHADTSSNYSTKPSSISDSKWSSTILTPTAAKPYVYVSAYTNNDGTYTFTTPALYSSLAGLISILEDDGIALISKVNNKYYLKADQLNGAMSDDVTIAGFTINDTTISSGSVASNNSVYISKGQLSSGVAIGGSSSLKNWAFTSGTDFGVTQTGQLYAKNAVIQGDLNADSGRIGDYLSIGNDGIYAENGSGNTVYSITDSGIEYFDTGYLKFNNVGLTTTKSSSTITTYLSDDSQATGLKFTSSASGATTEYYRVSVKLLAKGNVSGAPFGWDMGINSTFKFTLQRKIRNTWTNSSAPGISFMGLATIKDSHNASSPSVTLNFNNSANVTTDVDISKSYYSGGGDHNWTWRVMFTSKDGYAYSFSENSGYGPTIEKERTDNTLYWDSISTHTFSSTSPTNKSFDNEIEITLGYIYLKVTKNSTTMYSLSSIIPDTADALYLGSSSAKWLSVYAGSFETSSDRNTKYDIENFTESYDNVFDNLKPSIFKLVNGTSGRVHLGFIAQDVKDAVEKAGLTTHEFAAYCDYINPDLTDKDAHCGLRYDEFIALNTDQIQKLKKRVKTLEEEIQDLKTEIKNLKENS